MKVQICVKKVIDLNNNLQREQKMTGEEILGNNV